MWLFFFTGYRYLSRSVFLIEMLRCRSSGYLMLHVHLIGPRMWRCVGFPTLEQATCSLPCENDGLRWLNPTTFSVSPCALFILMEKHKRTGKWRRFNWMKKSKWIISTLEIKTSLHAACSVIMVVFSIFCVRCLVQSSVPLESEGGCKFLRCIIDPWLLVMYFVFKLRCNSLLPNCIGSTLELHYRMYTSQIGCQSKR